MPGASMPLAIGTAWHTNERECQDERNEWLKLQEDWSERVRPAFQKELDKRLWAMGIEEEKMQTALERMDQDFPNIWTAVEEWRTAWAARRRWVSGYAWIWRELDLPSPLAPVRRNRRTRTPDLPGGGKASSQTIAQDQKGVFDEVLSAMLARGGRLHPELDLPHPGSIAELESTGEWERLSKVE